MLINMLFGGWNIPTVESFHEDHFNPNDEKGDYYCWMVGSCTVGCGMHIWGIAKQVAVIASPVEMWDEVCIQDMVISCIILRNMMVQEQLEGGEESMGDYFQEGLPEDHDNDDGNSNIADEAEDHVNMLEAELSHGNVCNPQLQFQQD